MIDSKFINKNSILATIDPRIRVLFCFSYSIIVALMNNIDAVYFALSLPVILLFTNSINFANLFKRMSMVNGFIVMLWIFLPLSYPGDTLFHFKTLNFTKQGFDYAYLITLKSNAIVLTTIFLLGISSFIEIAHALDHLKVPKKLIILLFFCYRYIHDISQQYTKLHNSLKIRGFSPKTNIYTYKTYAYLVGILIVKSYDRAQRVIKAMMCRGFSGTFYTLNHFHFKKSDIVYSFCGVFYIFMLLGVTFWIV
jgi:cobalt/nickel transport system permease protein